MRSLKEKLATTLLDNSDRGNNISTEEFKWIMSHLPDSDMKGSNNEEVRGSNVFTFDHEKKSLLDAIGIDKAMYNTSMEKLNKIKKDTKSNSQFIEALCKLSDKEKDMAMFVMHEQWRSIRADTHLQKLDDVMKGFLKGLTGLSEDD